MSPVQSKPRDEPNTTLLILFTHPWEVCLHSIVYSRIAALPSNLVLHVKYTERAVTSLTTGLDGGDGLSGEQTCEKFHWRAKREKIKFSSNNAKRIKHRQGMLC